MRERILSSEHEAVSIKDLEALLQARIGWVNTAVSPFAVAARQEPLERNRVIILHRPKKSCLSEKELRLAG